MNVLVTGGGGFLGLAIVRRLLARGDTVRSLSRTRAPILDTLGVPQHLGSLDDASAVSDAVAGCDAVIHVAAKAGIWGPLREYERTNVVGTHNVLEACRAHGVSRLVYTSTPSVVHGGGDIVGLDESAPYATHFETAYPQTKAIAEREVLATDSPSLRTVALRPHLIWGPGDAHLLPRLLARVRAGRLRRIGDGNNLVDAVYVDNAADAHILALDRLGTHPEVVGGKAYFITNGEPVKLWELIASMLAPYGLTLPARGIPAGVAKLGGRLCEGVWKVLRLRGEPPMTKFVASQLSTSHWFRIEAAKRDLGYEPTVSMGEGLERLREEAERAMA